MDQLIPSNLLNKIRMQFPGSSSQVKKKNSKSKNISQDLEVTQKIVYKFYKLNMC